MISVTGAGNQDEDFSSTQVTVEEDEISIILTYLVDLLIKNDFWNLNE